ncbi:MAG: [FeFe] hydrogenase H-cluster maturation GTPase HydF [Treponema sp.]|nr:[FeFe] hydrogenase H-cluster maturation GTPase HydF [Treponema sp.]
MNETPRANRIHIGFFGCRNTGKSSLANAVTGQDLSLVSDVKGTTADPVYKSMELLPLGPVVIIDTPGIDDEGALGELRISRSRRVLNKTDVAVLITEMGSPLNAFEEELIEIFKSKKIPYVIAHNKADLLQKAHTQLLPAEVANLLNDTPEPPSSTAHCSLLPAHSPTPEATSSTVHCSLLTAHCSQIPVSAKTGYNINLLKETIAALAQNSEPKQLLEGLVDKRDFVLLVIPIDAAAPKERLILPQQQTIRCILDMGAVAVAAKDDELEETLASLGKKPALAITDSQVFAKVSALVPSEIPLTSFSILFARRKGWLETAVKGAAALDKLQDGDTVLICEGCTHHRQCDDIGTVKIPAMVKKYSGKEINFSFCSGGDFPEDLSAYCMAIHCGACMLSDREMQYRISCAEDQGTAFTNYGIAIAKMQGILERVVSK